MIATLTLALSLNSCQQAKVEHPAVLGDYATEEERAILEPIIASLKPEDRQNVVYIRRDGKVYSNRKDLRQLNVYHVRAPGTAVDISGQRVHIPTFQDRPASGVTAQATGILCKASDGPFHRVNTKTGTSSTPYNYLSASITLPPPADISIKTFADPKQNEATYAYLGGWGDAQDSAVDAGFVYSPVTQTWTQFILVQGSGLYVTTKPGETVPPRLYAGVIPTEFYVPQNDKVALAATASFTNGVTGRRTLVTDAATWKLNGVGNVLKYNVSMTQPAGKNFANGSYALGYEFKDLQLGGPLPARLWNSSDTLLYTNDADGNPIAAKGACDYPNDSTKILVNPISASNQRVSIKLHP
ncbi:hypothetical protein GCM10008956_40460 [Deinococcus arenae]|uniref:Uncharacterized protein n=1 Tax=Deinococcus arenae TaxID=1452751 RepID=A0A8H9GXS3_9DEIO|nr:hypothetical protein [Deinococcus arenae]GGM60726.1 hypothetical protein GCM10008956_40460 [Deinococcus arenae]